MKNTNLFMPALALVTLLLPLAAGFIRTDVMFVFLLIAVVISMRFIGHQELTKYCIDIIFYAGSLILTFYFVDTAVSHQMFSFFDSLSNRKAFTDMLALWVMLEAVLRYTYAEDTHMDITYITAGIISEMTLIINGEWIMQFFMFIVILGVASNIMPLAKRMKRVLQFLFGAAFIMCNASLIFTYTQLIKVENIRYSLEVSIVSELILSIAALYIMHEWEKIPSDADIERVRLCGLQGKISKTVKIVLILFVVVGLIGYDMGLGAGNTHIALLSENGESIQTGIFANTLNDVIYHVYNAFGEVFKNNILAVGFLHCGWIGILAALIFVCLGAGLIYGGYTYGFNGKERFAVIAILELVQLICMPVAWELIPMYALFLYGALEKCIKITIKEHKIELNYRNR